MKFSTSKNELQEALQKLSKATPLRSTLPILSCILIKATNEKTTLIATDLELTIDIKLSVSIEEEGSAAAIPPKPDPIIIEFIITIYSIFYKCNEIILRL